MVVHLRVLRCHITQLKALLVDAIAGVVEISNHFEGVLVKPGRHVDFVLSVVWGACLLETSNGK